MMRDIRRICENPSAEDRAWFPDIAGSPWRDTLGFAMRDFKDESFVLQFLSPELIRELKLFNVLDDSEGDYLEVAAIHDEVGYQEIRESLAATYNLGNTEPSIQVYGVNLRGDRALTLRHEMHQGRPLNQEDAQEVVRHIHTLWGFEVVLESVDGETVRQSVNYSELDDEV